MASDCREARGTCHHESGHVVCAITRGVPVERVAISPCCEKEHVGEAAYAELGGDFDMIVCALGGSIAEQRFTGRANKAGAAGDRANIERILTLRYGRKIEGLDAPIITDARAEAEGIVERRWWEIKTLAAELLERFEITGDDIRQIVARAAAVRFTKKIEQLKRRGKA